MEWERERERLAWHSSYSRLISKKHMESRVEWIYHTLEDEAHFLDSNNVLVGCRNALWDLLRRSGDAWEMQWVLIALAPSAFYIFKEIRCTHFFFPCITFIIWKKTDWWSKDRLTHKLYLHHHMHHHIVLSRQ